MAESEGFEPSIRCRIHTFQACSFSHSDNSPNSFDINLYYLNSFPSKISGIARGIDSKRDCISRLDPCGAPAAVQIANAICRTLDTLPYTPFQACTLLRHLPATGREAYMIRPAPAISYAARALLFYNASNTNTCEIRVSSSGAEL